MATESVPDTWAHGDAYDRYVGRWSRRVAPAFLDWLDLPRGLRWVDVGCGTGALSRAILDLAAPASLVGVEPSEGFLATAAERLGDRVVLHRAGGEALPLQDHSADVVVSGLVLNFVPDQQLALREAARVAAGGTVAAYLWDYAEGMQFMRVFWDAANSVDPRAAQLDEASRFPIATAEGLAAAFTDAGLGSVQVAALEVPTVFADFGDLWMPFLGGQGSAPSYLATLDDERRDTVRDAVRARVSPAADGSIALVARAWAARGTA
jgi:SAM-dependent methyltransferase